MLFLIFSTFVGQSWRVWECLLCLNFAGKLLLKLCCKRTDRLDLLRVLYCCSTLAACAYCCKHGCHRLSWWSVASSTLHSSAVVAVRQEEGEQGRAIESAITLSSRGTMAVSLWMSPLATCQKWTLSSALISWQNVGLSVTAKSVINVSLSKALLGRCWLMHHCFFHWHQWLLWQYQYNRKWTVPDQMKFT